MSPVNFTEEQNVCLAPAVDLKLMIRISNCLEAQKSCLVVLGAMLNQISEAMLISSSISLKEKHNQQQRHHVLLTNLIMLRLFALITFND